MGLRTKIREHLSGLLSGGKPTASALVPKAAAPPAPARPAPAARPLPAAPSAAAASPAAAPPAPALSAEEQAKADKIAAHYEKARKGVLVKLAELGGKAPLADLHDYSERRYFIAHAAFSRMMEGFVAENLLDFNSTTGEATLTDAGRAFTSAERGS